MFKRRKKEKAPAEQKEDTRSPFQIALDNAYNDGSADGYRNGYENGRFVGSITTAALGVAAFLGSYYFTNGHLPFIQKEPSTCTTTIDFAKDEAGRIASSVTTTVCR